MNYGEIKENDIADGLGVRVALFVSGCRNRCKGCFNECTWDFSYGKPFTRETEDLILKLLDRAHISGLSVLGGEPFEEENQAVLAPFLQRVKSAFPQKDIWCYTGYTLDDLRAGGRKNTPFAEQMLSCIDILVDGPFVLAEKNLMLSFRGSENQRILNLKNYPEFSDITSEF